MTKLIGCQCSEAQLNRVGCECVVFTVEIWPKGYAAETGLARVQMAHCANFEVEARKLFGSFASISSKRETYPVRKVENFSAEYIKEMSKGG